MSAEVVTLPFTVGYLYQGFAECKGLARADSAELTLEYVIKETVLEMFKSGMNKVTLPLNELSSIRIGKGWLSLKVIIAAKSMERINKLPGSEQGKIELSIRRSDKEAAEAFVAFVSEHIPR